MGRHIISSSDGNSLHFETNEEYEKYKEEELALFYRHHFILRDRYGIYATNQGKYVNSVDDLNDLDSRQHV